MPMGSDIKEVPDCRLEKLEEKDVKRMEIRFTTETRVDLSFSTIRKKKTSDDWYFFEFWNRVRDTYHIEPGQGMDRSLHGNHWFRKRLNRLKFETEFKQDDHDPPEEMLLQKGVEYHDRYEQLLDVLCCQMIEYLSHKRIFGSDACSGADTVPEASQISTKSHMNGMA